MPHIPSRSNKGSSIYRGNRRNPRSSHYQILAQFRYLLRQFSNFSEAAARTAGITAQQHQALLAIRGFSIEEPLSIGGLAKRLSLQSHSTVGLVNRLARRGLVHRRPDPEDARRVQLELTAKGSKLLARLSKVHRRELRQLAPLLRHLLAQLS